MKKNIGQFIRIGPVYMKMQFSSLKKDRKDFENALKAIKELFGSTME